MKKALLVVALASSVTYAGWKWWSEDAPIQATGASLTLDRIWIDHIPQHDRDTFQLFVALTEQPVGIFQKASQWQGAYEIFMFEAHGDELRMRYPQTGEREQVVAKSRTCNEGPMDYCLEMKGGTRGVKRYYSRKGWEIDGAASDGAASIEQLRQRAGALVEQLAR